MQRYVDHVESVKYVRGDDWRHEDARHAGHDKAKRRGSFSRICCGFSITAYVHIQNLKQLAQAQNPYFHNVICLLHPHMDLSGELDFKRIESLIRERNSGLDLHRMIRESDAKDQEIMFIEGPPTMNGIPHAGHLRGRVIKDLWYRYNVLQGKKVIFNAGWDTQGLPVELQAQKEMGVTGGKSEMVEKVGIRNLVARCKDLVDRYSQKWIEADNLLGMSLNHDGAYWTFLDGYIQREWQFLKRANETGILEDDYTVIAYCPSCQTSLSHAEVNQGYEEVEDPSLYYKVKLADEDAYLVVWTTMPFTLVTDAMVGLHPREKYHYIRTGDQTWIVGATRLEEFLQEARIGEHTVLRTVTGADLEGRRYIHPLLDRIPKLRELSREPGYHTAVSEEFVDVGAGSGLVHLSPANGEEDIGIANRRGVRVFNPIDDEVRFTREAGEYAGLFVRDADQRIVDDLESGGSLVSIRRIKHKYPLCWRSRHRIVWLARRGWFYKLDRLGQKAIEAAEAVEYFYEQPRNRFLGIVRERHPWCISRERFWGCPIPVWSCRLCGHRSWFYSREEIVAASAELPDGRDFELHRPWIDGVKVHCQKCGSADTQREPYVLDTWHNSGSAPYSSLDDETYSGHIPAPFFTEGIDQTRGWAYTLLVENVILNDAPVSPYSAFLFQGHVLDKNGNKMSKSLGNVLDARELLQEYPVDLVRFYFLWKSSPIEALNFSTEELMSRPYQVLSTLYNLHLYFKQNSEYDKFDDSYDTGWAEGRGLLTAPDMWLLSRLQKLIKRVSRNNDRCRFHESARALEEFVIDTLSQSYIPITRGELWDEDGSKRDRRLAIYAVLRLALQSLDVMIHPMCPYTSEYLYLCLSGREQSILLDGWPQADGALEDNPLEESFALMRDAVSVAAAARMSGRLKRRWPLDEAIVCVAPGQKDKLDRLADLLVSQLNVQRCTIVELTGSPGLDRLAEMLKLGLPVMPVLQLDRKRIGPRAKQHMAALLAGFSKADPREILRELAENGEFSLDARKSVVLGADDVTVGFDAQDGYATASRDRCTVLIPTVRSPEMVARGLVKDLARRLQDLRKKRGYNPTAVLDVASILDLEPEQLEMVRARADDLRFLVRVRQVSFEEVCREYEQVDIDGQKIRISIE